MWPQYLGAPRRVHHLAGVTGTRGNNAPCCWFPQVGAVVEVKNQDGVYQEATINKLTDASIYTVGMFRNTTLCFPQHSAALFMSVYGEPSKGGLHFFQSVLLKKKKKIFQEPSSLDCSEKVKSHVISRCETFAQSVAIPTQFFSNEVKFRDTKKSN